MPTEQRCRCRRCSLKRDHGHTSTTLRIDDLEREVTGRAHTSGADADLSGIFFRKLHYVLKSRLRRIASNHEHDWRPGRQPERREILEGVIRNRLRIEYPA